MIETAPTTQQPEDIEHRELASVVVTDTVPKRGLVRVRVDKEESFELIRRLIMSHYHERPEQIASWVEQLNGMVRQLDIEENDYGVILFDDILSDDPLRSGWMADAYTYGGDVGIVFKRTGNVRDFPYNVGRKLGDKLQSEILEAMQAR